MNLKLKSLSLLLAGAAMGLTGCQTEDLVIDEGGIGNGTASTGKVVYLTAGIALPTNAGSRSQTDTPDNSDNNKTNSDGDKNMPDYEYGWDYENDVRSLIVVIADEEDAYVSHSIVSGIIPAASTNTKYDFTFTAEIKHKDLKDAYDSGLFSATNKTAHIYVICNYTARLLKLFEEGENGSWENWVNWTGSVTESGSPAGQTPSTSNTIWAKNSFLMTNAEALDCVFPETIDVWDDKFSDKSTPYNVGKVYNELYPIKVERVAARIDFKDGSPKGNNIYPISLDINHDGKIDDNDLNLINVELTRMALVNMSKNFYYLRRVSDNGLPDGAGFKIGGIEGLNNYVVDTDAGTKSAVQGYDPKTKNTDYIAHFNFPLYDSNNGYNKTEWYVDNIKDVLDESKQSDLWGTPEGQTTAGSYKIWRYVTENTIPGIDQQKTVQSTGVVFKGRILPGADLATKSEGYLSQAVVEALQEAEKAVGSRNPQKMVTLYNYNDVLYAGAAELIAKAKSEDEGALLYDWMETLLNNWTLNGDTYEYNPDGSGDKLTVVIADEILNGDNNDKHIDFGDYKAFNKGIAKSIDVASVGVTVYEPTDENDGEGLGYWCYYFYWNRHNDNLNSGRMGTMEFATVRNNVYKLSVTKINRLGNPTNPDNDPDPKDPEDPDEEPLDYIKVQVEVLPWVVRVNNIEF